MFEGSEVLFVVQMFGSPAKVALRAGSEITPRSPPTVPKQELVPITASEVLGKSAEQTFVAVKDANAVPLTENIAAASSAPVHYASFAERLITSPTKLLALVYLTLIVLLLAALAGVLYIRHTRRIHHTLYILMLLLVISLVYYVYRFWILSSVVVQ
jgi:hypothetical protein